MLKEFGNSDRIRLKKGVVPSIFYAVEEKIVSCIDNSISDHNYAKRSSNMQVNKSVRRELFIEPYKLNEEFSNKRLKLFEVMLLVFISLFNTYCMYSGQIKRNSLYYDTNFYV